MKASDLSPLTNNWWRVHNFTPESVKYTLIDLDNSKTNNNEDDNLIEFSLNELFCKNYLSTSENVCNLTFSIHSSYFFHVERNKLIRPNEVKFIHRFIKLINFNNFFKFRIALSFF